MRDSWYRQHIDLISKLKLALIILCLVAIPASYALQRQDLGDVTNRVERIEPACIRYGSQSEQCRRSFTAALQSITPGQVCYVLAQVDFVPPFCVKPGERTPRR